MSRHASIRSIAAPLGNANPVGSEASNVRTLRRLARKKVNFAAFATCGEAIYSIEIQNISQGGAGFRLSRTLEHDAPIALHFLSGRAVAARVLWVRFGFCGVEFESPLSEDDELLSEPGAGCISQRQETAESASVKAETNRAYSEKIGLNGLNARIETSQRRLASAWRMLVSAVVAGAKSRSSRRNKIMMETACRKQGYAWLVDVESDP